MQAADRVAHRIEVLDPAAQLLAELRSVEGSSAEEWPSSPALQSCSLQEIRPGQTAAFLVGMSGKSHWSASMEAVPHECEFVFDFACRVQSLPPWLGNSYDIHIRSLHTGVDFQVSSAGIGIHLSTPASELPGVDSGQPGVQPLRFAGPKVTTAKFPTTLRWQYRIYLTGGGDLLITR
ncbi:MAG: hypothetical protein ACR2FY_19030 [Pirellulaceae bacterium]